MRKLNRVFLSGPVGPGSKDKYGDNYAYVNCTVNGINVSVTFGGDNYSKDKAESFGKMLESGGYVAISGNASIEPMSYGDKDMYQVKCSNSDVVFTKTQLSPIASVHMYGTVSEMSTDSEGTCWIKINTPKPKRGGGFTDRIVNAKLPRPLGGEFVGKHLLLIGGLNIHPGQTGSAYVDVREMAPVNI